MKALIRWIVAILRLEPPQLEDSKRKELEDELRRTDKEFAEAVARIDTGIEAMANEAMVRFTTAEQHNPNLTKLREGSDVLLRGLFDDDREVRYWALDFVSSGRAFAVVDRNLAIEELEKMFDVESDMELRQGALVGLCNLVTLISDRERMQNLGHRCAKMALDEQLAMDVRYAAYRALGCMSIETIFKAALVSTDLRDANWAYVRSWLKYNRPTTRRWSIW